jgi:hypothetical protein
MILSIPVGRNLDPFHFVFLRFFDETPRASKKARFFHIQAGCGVDIY